MWFSNIRYSIPTLRDDIRYTIFEVRSTIYDLGSVQCSAKSVQLISLKQSELRFTTRGEAKRAMYGVNSFLIRVIRVICK